MGQALSLMDMRNDVAPPDRTPRADSIAHIRGVLIEAGLDPDRGNTVGHGVIANIANLHSLFEEKGARTIDEVFKNPELTPHYLKPSSDREAHGAIVDADMSYWDHQNRTNPSAGTRAAVQFDRDTRIALQQGMATINNQGHVFLDDYRAQMNPVAGHARAAMSAAPSAQQRSQQSSSSPAGRTYPGHTPPSNNGARRKGR
ncbi:hypothetical protein MMF93_19695 [Streptomyces tubbatahanensis]|uniref:Uncharacterized protein n=1 Tax=Streptomyces tubbatahanensis TaxID=2923272 RepID=A0ABY3XVN7_9ACTN|nr:hypothetical protein [Streptomyces tubbatahanensis]UNS98424.1 hypothetical protein MMF93_19695 [Streptomyces tubbatahanensis]